MCTKMCITCPFNWTDESAQVQNYGCLPGSMEIIEMKKETGDNWACHSNPKRMCEGLKEWNERKPPYEFSGRQDDPRPLDLSKGSLIVQEGVHYSVDPKTGKRV